MSTFTIDQAGIDEIATKQGGLSNKEAHRIGSSIVILAKRYVGVNTGILRKRISYRVLRRAAGYVIEVTADTDYAAMHHNGTRPHVIRPNTQKVLRFKKGGRVVYADRVFHPGTRPNPFLVRAMREVVK